MNPTENSGKEQPQLPSSKPIELEVVLLAPIPRQGYLPNGQPWRAPTAEEIRSWSPKERKDDEREQHS